MDTTANIDEPKQKQNSGFTNAVGKPSSQDSKSTAETKEENSSQKQGNTHSKKAKQTDTEASGNSPEVTSDSSKENTKDNSFSTMEQLDLARLSFVEQLSDVISRVKALTPKSGVLNHMSTFVTDRLATTSAYLDGKTATKIGGEALKIVRKNYIPIALSIVGAGAGVLISRKMASVGEADSESSPEKKGNLAPVTNLLKASGASH